jgi:predicted aldo/keto reductase-like oxidoreductase
VNYFDTAAAGAYGLSQTRYGVALKGVRDRVVLATKTRHRTYTQAEIDLNQSLANLATDHVDLYQIHNVMNEEDIEFIFARRGVMELVEKAKQAGKIRFVGVTGHTDPTILNKIIEQYAFDTVLMPLSVTDGANHAKSFEERTLPLAREKRMGVIAMKTLGAGALLQQRVISQEEALRYVWTLPISTAILGCSTAEQIRADAHLAQAAKSLSATALEELRRRAAPLARAHEPWKGVARGDEPVYQAD